MSWLFSYRHQRIPGCSNFFSGFFLGVLFLILTFSSVFNHQIPACSPVVPCSWLFYFCPREFPLPSSKKLNFQGEESRRLFYRLFETVQCTLLEYCLKRTFHRHKTGLTWADAIPGPDCFPVFRPRVKWTVPAFCLQNQPLIFSIILSLIPQGFLHMISLVS